MISGRVTMTRVAAEITCEACYFRQKGLCALVTGPCPTFRPARGVVLAPPPPAPLVASRDARRSAAA